ncbi:MAG: ribose-phosphate pyrophosphokinase [Candidatus Eisenbacteria bacterium]|uniref:Ribose-phosphate pyrophosphokinase n=1 Tax=Eiseniibacteriota bacterium TaxID=2212470 RepID=A0A956M1B9_UNCEI|nr:ribose-phosphate pyrophosphokinase [Candidatus Eisenbacteria bacterium]
MVDSLRVFSGSAHPDLARSICSYLRVDPGEAEVDRFPDGEITVKINENVRGCDIFIVQPTGAPAESLLELLIMMDAAKRASAQRVTAVIPYFGYARQDRKDQPRVPISAKLVANLIAEAGADRVLTMDLHSSQIQGFFDIPLDHLFAAPVLIEYFHRKEIPNLTVVAPDVGSLKMARAYAKRLGASLALVDKRRTRADDTEVMNLIGEVQDRNIVIFDDVISTGRTIAKAAVALKERGATSIRVGVTHAVFAPQTEAVLGAAPIEEVVVTDSVPPRPVDLGHKLQTLSVSRLLGEAIRRIHEERSLSSLFV